jgi:hypothetical protein
VHYIIRRVQCVLVNFTTLSHVKVIGFDLNSDLAVWLELFIVPVC